MKCNGSVGRRGAALLAVVVVTLMSVPSIWAAGKYKTLHQFRGVDGDAPLAGLIFDTAGNLYGTTSFGGVGAGCGGCGTVFELTPNPDGSWKEKTLYSFCPTTCRDGIEPQASLIFDAEGNLYGTTRFTGAGVCCGTVFELTPNSGGGWAFKVLYTFTGGADGDQPLAGLTFDAAGSLYGTTFYGGILTCGEPVGCGVVFKLTPNSDGSWTQSVLHRFTGSDGRFPAAGVILDAAGNIYGTTELGGALDDGTVFKLSGTGKETVLFSFNQILGYEPVGGLVLDPAGNLYGTTWEGGSNINSPCGTNVGCGTVFKLTPKTRGGWTEGVLYNFCSVTNCSDGGEPYAGLTFDQAGNLYGTTKVGGVGWGVVFKLSRNSKGGWSEKVLHRFLDHPGYAPVAGVIFDAAGNLYGTTVGDNYTTFGSVFEITP
jgi:uncharacterized repeat protein (TIGR03803 family)